MTRYNVYDGISSCNFGMILFWNRVVIWFHFKISVPAPCPVQDFQNQTTQVPACIESLMAVFFKQQGFRECFLA